MAPEYVFGEEDSEDEVDDDVADLEDRRVRSVWTHNNLTNGYNFH